MTSVGPTSRRRNPGTLRNQGGGDDQVENFTPTSRSRAPKGLVLPTGPGPESRGLGRAPTGLGTVVPRGSPPRGATTEDVPTPGPCRDPSVTPSTTSPHLCPSPSRPVPPSRRRSPVPTGSSPAPLYSSRGRLGDVTYLDTETRPSPLPSTLPDSRRSHSSFPTPD